MNSAKHSPILVWIRRTFGPDERFEGVYKINIYLLRLMFFLIVVFVGRDSWTTILTHQGPWDYLQAVAYCVWAAFSVLCVVAFIHPLKMLPIVLFEILYKSIWLVIVAYPLWKTNQLAGSPAEGLTNAFLWLPLPLLATPWPYVLRTYFSFPKRTKAAPAYHRQVGNEAA